MNKLVKYNGLIKAINKKTVMASGLNIKGMYIVVVEVISGKVEILKTDTFSTKLDMVNMANMVQSIRDTEMMFSNNKTIMDSMTMMKGDLATWKIEAMLDLIWSVKVSMLEGTKVAGLEHNVEFTRMTNLPMMSHMAEMTSTIKEDMKVTEIESYCKALNMEDIKDRMVDAMREMISKKDQRAEFRSEKIGNSVIQEDINKMMEKLNSELFRSVASLKGTITKMPVLEEMPIMDRNMQFMTKVSPSIGVKLYEDTFGFSKVYTEPIRTNLDRETAKKKAMIGDGIDKTLLSKFFSWVEMEEGKSNLSYRTEVSKFGGDRQHP